VGSLTHVTWRYFRHIYDMFGMARRQELEEIFFQSSLALTVSLGAGRLQRKGELFVKIGSKVAGR